MAYDRPGEVPHGDRLCRITERFFCVVCWRLACWCTGSADQADEALGDLYTASVPTGDASICDECHSVPGRQTEVLASQVHPVLPPLGSRFL